MRGFRTRTTVEEALAWIDEQTFPGSSESIDISQATGRVLAEDIISTIDVPSFDRSAMDGYAVRAEETTGASVYNPLPFAVIGQSLPGRICDAVIHNGQAVRIMTGGALAPRSGCGRAGRICCRV